MSGSVRRTVLASGFILPAMMICALFVFAETDSQGAAKAASDESKKCVVCHRTLSPALVMEWERSRHAQNGVGCLDCHGADETDVDGWTHHGTQVSVLVTPKDCGTCHADEYRQSAGSHHARAGQILASLGNVLAEKVAGMPGNNADAVNGCRQCHGTIVKFQRDKDGNILRSGEEQWPLLDPTT